MRAKEFSIQVFTSVLAKAGTTVMVCFGGFTHSVLLTTLLPFRPMRAKEFSIQVFTSVLAKAGTTVMVCFGGFTHSVLLTSLFGE